MAAYAASAAATCYELFSSLTCAYHAFTSSFSFMIDMHFTTG